MNSAKQEIKTMMNHMNEIYHHQYSIVLDLIRLFLIKFIQFGSDITIIHRNWCIFMFRMHLTLNSFRCSFHRQGS